MFHVQGRLPLAVNMQGVPQQYSQALIQDSSDEAFFASLAVFDEVDFTVSADAELTNWKTSSSPEPVYEPYSQFERTSAPKRTYSVASFSDSSYQYSTYNEPEERQQQAQSSGTKKVTVDNISPCGLRKSVKVDDSELAFLNPVLAQLAALSDSATVDVPPQPQQQATTSSGQQHTAGHSGETRLRISFHELGRRGAQVQRFGKSGCIIPDGLSGTHEMYDQPWKFEVKHEPQMGSSLVLITWKITNVVSGSVTCVKETAQQATLREFSGRTICNKVVKMALTGRAKELEDSIVLLKDGSRKQSVENAVRVLRPKLCTVGLLFFGLLHDSVQNKFS